MKNAAYRKLVEETCKPRLDEDSVEELDAVEVFWKKVEEVRCDGKCLRSW
jgi:hypothetical protein